VAKKVFLAFRLVPDLKKEVEEIADREQRSVSQICELLLRGGVDAYKKDGSRYLQHLLASEAAKK
jgi:predicted transcriptional regulator